MSVYVDASVLVGLFLDEPNAEAIASWAQGSDDILLVADLVATEFGAAVSRAVRTGRLRERVAARMHATFAEWRTLASEAIETQPVDIRLAGMLVRQPLPKLLAPDAIHVATCLRLGSTLATFDKDLLIIAEREGLTTISPA